MEESVGFTTANITQLKEFHGYKRGKHRLLVAFRWSEKTYHFRTPTFGIAHAPSLFTKIMTRVLQSLREHGMHLFFYLDDICLLDCSREQANKYAYIEMCKYRLLPPKVDANILNRVVWRTLLVFFLKNIFQNIVHLSVQNVSARTRNKVALR